MLTEKNNKKRSTRELSNYIINNNSVSNLIK